MTTIGNGPEQVLQQAQSKSHFVQTLCTPKRGHTQLFGAFLITIAICTTRFLPPIRHLAPTPSPTLPLPQPPPTPPPQNAAPSLQQRYLVLRILWHIEHARSPLRTFLQRVRPTPAKVAAPRPFSLRYRRAAWSDKDSLRTAADENNVWYLRSFFPRERR